MSLSMIRYLEWWLEEMGDTQLSFKLSDLARSLRLGSRFEANHGRQSLWLKYLRSTISILHRGVLQGLEEYS